MATTHISVVSPAELSAAGIRLRHADAVAIAREISLRVSRGELTGVPAPQAIRLGSDGSITSEGEAPAGRELERAACLLEVLSADAITEAAAPAALRLIVARAYAKDEAAFASLERFADALAPFASPDSAEAVRTVVETWKHASGDVSMPPAPAAVDNDAPVENHGAVEAAFDDVDDLGRDCVVEDEGKPLPATPIVVPITPLPNRVKPRSWVAIRAPHSPVDDDAWVRVQEFLLANFDTEKFEAGSISLRPAADRRRPVEALPEPVPAQAPSRRFPPVPPRPALWAAGLAVAAVLTVVAITRMRPDTPAHAEAGAIGSVSQPGPTAPAAPADVVVKDAAPTEVPAPAAETPVSLPTVPAAPIKERTPDRRQLVPSGGRPASQTSSGGSRPANVLPEAAYSPAFSTATSAMFYHSGTGPESSIMRADTDISGAVLRVTSVVGDRGSNFHPRPSPDGKSIAFDSDRDGERGVYVADADGRGVRRVSGAGFAAVPSWSPDGRRLAFVRAESGRPKVWNIWTVDLVSGAGTRVTSHRYGQPWGASWFPDGNRIAYSHEDRLIVQSLSGGPLRTFASPVRGRLVRTPAISPDGRRIIFQVRHDGAWLLDLTNDSMRRVLEDPSAEEFTWSPDGRRVAYHSRRSGTWGVWIMAPRED